jgi:F-type H+-transporting ATPase subunit b
MPQFDITHYSSQIFWFLLCFLVLYIFTSRIILPRITNILKSRKSVIDAELSSTAELDEKIHQLQIKTDNLRKEAGQKYQSKLEETSKEAAKQRDKMIEEFKEKFEEITKKSRQELKNFVDKSNSESEVVIKNLAQKISNKLLSN